MKRLLILAFIFLFSPPAFALEELSDEELDSVRSYGVDTSLLLKEQWRQQQFESQIAVLNLQNAKNLIGIKDDQIFSRYQLAMERMLEPTIKFENPAHFMVPITAVQINMEAPFVIKPDLQFNEVYSLTYQAPLFTAPTIQQMEPISSNTFSGDFGVNLGTDSAPHVTISGTGTTFR